MKSSLKLASYLSVLSSIFIIDSAQALMECPTLTKPELKQLCRWTGFKKVPFMKIEAGEVTTKEGITLVNKLGTCRELDSIRAFFTSDPNKTYSGVREKDPLDPNNPLKGLCTYTISTFTIGKPPEKIGFEVTFPPEPEVIPPPPPVKKHVIGGVDITTSPEMQEVEIRKKPSEELIPAKKARPVPVRPDLIPFASPLKIAPAEEAEEAQPQPRLRPLPPPRRPLQAMQDEQAPSSRPPARKPPPVPSPQPALENEENETAPSQSSAPKLTMQSELEQRLQKRQKALAEAGQ